jgi:hypothetical protein
MIGCVFETIGRVVMTSVFANSTTYTNWILNEVNGHCVTQNAINDLIMRRSLFTIVLTLRNVFISSNVFFLKVEKKNCLCKDNSSCIDQLKNQCSSSIIQYSNGAIIAPYAFKFYSTVRDWSNKIPDGIIIKCWGYMADELTIFWYPSRLLLSQLELWMNIKIVSTMRTKD